jgi:hypothetical protein
MLMNIIFAIIVIFAISKIFRFFSKFGGVPTLEEYLVTHPECKTERGIKCCHCNSPSIKNWGKNHANDKDRCFICNHCGETLYRSNTVYTPREANRIINGNQQSNEKKPWES